MIGKISMDLTVLDVTDVPDANPGDPVTVFDHRPDRPNSVESLARLLDTIPYEITCLLGDRIQRLAVKEFEMPKIPDSTEGAPLRDAIQL